MLPKNHPIPIPFVFVRHLISYAQALMCPPTSSSTWSFNVANPLSCGSQKKKAKAKARKKDRGMTYTAQFAPRFPFSPPSCHAVQCRTLPLGYHISWKDPKMKSNQNKQGKKKQKTHAHSEPNHLAHSAKIAGSHEFFVNSSIGKPPV